MSSVVVLTDVRGEWWLRNEAALWTGLVGVMKSPSGEQCSERLRSGSGWGKGGRAYFALPPSPPKRAFIVAERGKGLVGVA